VPWDVYCGGTFSAVGRSVMWDVLCCGRFSEVGGLEMGRFESRTFSAVGRFELLDV
jgi:hypothetical protein